MNNKIMIAMSGGVDSAVSAFLASRGRTACGVTMRLAFDHGEHEKAAVQDIKDAASTCEVLGIPHVVAELSEEFRALVVNAFVRAYEEGKTPNPCIDCNKEIKFGALLRFAAEHGFNRLATGHYARIEKDGNGRFLLRRAKDLTKDQTYVLYTLSQEVLSRTEFPLGDMSKAEVREIAAAQSFVAAHKSESQDICFIPNGDYATFIKDHSTRTPLPGKFLSLDGQVLGEHRGIVHYTIGQRKGLGISLGRPAFVVSKSAANNTVTLGTNEDLFTSRLIARKINFITEDTLSTPRKLLAKVRYRLKATLARVEQIGEDELTVEFDTPQRAISKGQSLVLYEDDYLFGGGIICS